MSEPTNNFDDDLGLELDLDKARSARAEVRSIPTVKIGGEVLELPAELPLDVLEPLTTINVDVSVLIRQVLDARRDNEDVAAIMEAVVDMLIVNPKLPTEVVEAVKEMARRLFGEESYEHLVKQRLTITDVGALGRFVLRRYGVGLGESSPSSDSSEGTGTTSKPTSRAGTRKSTSGTSGARRRPRAS